MPSRCWPTPHPTSRRKLIEENLIPTAQRAENRSPAGRRQATSHRISQAGGAAIERRDGVALGLALDRIGAWQRRLLAGSPMLAAQQRELATLRALALRHDSPLAGSSLQQLRALRGR